MSQINIASPAVLVGAATPTKRTKQPGCRDLDRALKSPGGGHWSDSRLTRAWRGCCFSSAEVGPVRSRKMRDAPTSRRRDT